MSSVIKLQPYAVAFVGFSFQGASFNDSSGRICLINMLADSYQNLRRQVSPIGSLSTQIDSAKPAIDTEITSESKVL
jgi:hypothetical protein